ncbi:MAG: response regulator [Variibacter sp.]|nr:response regulator [Variibacter sp.]
MFLLTFGPYASILLGLAVALLIWAGALHSIVAEHGHAETAALQNSRNLVRTFEEQIFRSVRAADQTLLYVRDAYARDPKNFDMSLWSASSHFISDLAFQLSIVDSRGMMVANNLGTATRPIDLSDREHVRIHTQRRRDELFISKPVLGRVSGKWSIQLTRRINNRDGSFGGVVVVSLDSNYLSRFFETIDVGSRGSIALLSADGTVLSRAARGGGGTGESLAGGALMQMFEDTAAGTYVGKSELDGIERLFTYRLVRGYPLIVTVGMATDEIFATYEANRRSYLIAACVLTLLMLALALLSRSYQRSLAKARDAAEDGTRARSEFLAVMSHEIRTPMNAVLGLTTTLLETKLDSDQRQQVASIHEAGDNLLRILNDILDFSRLDTGHIQLESIPFSPATVVENTVGVIRHHAFAKGLTINAEIDPRLPAALLGDAGRIRQVLLNLLSNAVKFTTRGSVSVRLACTDKSADAATLEWSVSDTGIGIAPDRIDSIFAEFVQGDSSIHRRFGGSGLGLAICKRIVEQMGGTLTVTSTIGAGATFRFTVTLPVATEMDDGREAVEQEQQRELVGRIAALQRPLRVLLAEDNPTNQLVVTKLLKSLDVEVKLAADGAEAIQLASDGSFDLILMDMQMPTVNGIEATQAIRARGGSLAALPIVALTANAYPEDVKACFDAGMTGFIAKPVRKPALIDAMMQAIAQLGPAARASDPAPSPDAPALDTAALDLLAREIGPDGLLETLQIFIAETEKRLALLASLRCGDAERGTIKSEAHTLKGASGTCGFAELSALARGLEQSAAAITADDYVRVVGQLKQAFAHARAKAPERLPEAA